MVYNSVLVSSSLLFLWSEHCLYLTGREGGISLIWSLILVPCPPCYYDSYDDDPPTSLAGLGGVLRLELLLDPRLCRGDPSRFVS